jgi:hypothetical protein
MARKWCKLFEVDGEQILFMLAGQREGVDEECCMNVTLMYEGIWATITFSYQTEEDGYAQIEKLDKKLANKMYSSLLEYVSENIKTNQH